MEKKININSAILLDSLSFVKNVINTKNALPILDDYLFEVQQNQIVVSASDLETRVSAKIQATNEEQFSFCINAKKLNDILSMLKGADITILIDDTNLQSTIVAPMGKYKIPFEPSEDFPQYTPITTDTNIEIKPNELYDGIFYTIFAVSTEPSRPIFNSVNLSLNQTDMNFTATDSHRLSRVSFPNMSTTVTNLSINIPTKTANVILPIAKSTTENISIQISTDRISLSTNRFQISARLIEGKFPDCDRIIPKQFKFIHNITKSTFQDAIKRVAYFSNAKTNMVKFEFNTKDKIAISAQDFDFKTSASEIVDINPEIVPPTEQNEEPIAFKSSFFLGFLDKVSSPDVLVKLNSPTQPCVLEPTNENNNITFLIMPMSIQ